MTTAEHKVFSGLLKEMSKAEDGWKLTVDIQAIAKKFPTVIYRVPEGDVVGLKIGQAYNFILSRGNLKKDKDGSWPNHYYWNYQGLQEASAPPGIPSPGNPAESLVSAPRVRDPRELSIERQVALKEARLLTEWFVSSLDLAIRSQAAGETATEMQGFILKILERNFGACLTLVSTRVETEEMPTAMKEQPPGGAPPMPSKVTGHGDLWNQGLKMGYKGKQEMLRVLDVMNDAEIKDLDAALAKLQAHIASGHLP